MDQDLHDELTKLHTNVALLVERTDKLPAVLKQHDERIAQLELDKKKVVWTVAGGAAVMQGCWVVAYFIFKELLK